MQVLYVFRVIISACIFRYFSICTMTIPTYTDIYLHIMTYLHIVSRYCMSLCVGIIFRYLLHTYRYGAHFLHTYKCLPTGSLMISQVRSRAEHRLDRVLARPGPIRRHCTYCSRIPDLPGPYEAGSRPCPARSAASGPPLQRWRRWKGGGGLERWAAMAGRDEKQRWQEECRQRRKQPALGGSGRPACWPLHELKPRVSFSFCKMCRSEMVAKYIC
jgi:hypothetical protein